MKNALKYIASLLFMVNLSGCQLGMSVKSADAPVMVSGNLIAPPCQPSEKSVSVQEWHWVSVRNLDGIANNNVTYNFGDNCGIDSGGNLSIIGADGDQVLVEYKNCAPAHGTICPSGTIFWIKKDELEKLANSKTQQLVNAEKENIRKLLERRK